MVERGGVPLVQKAAHAQAAGAYGVIVVDTAGRCDAGFNQFCCPGADKYKGEGSHLDLFSLDACYLFRVLCGTFLQSHPY